MQNQISNNWQVDNLENLLTLIMDRRGLTPKKLKGYWSSEGFPALSAKNIKTGKIINQQEIRFVNKQLYDKWMPEKIDEGDILLTSEAPLGELFLLREKKDYVLSQRLFALRTDKTKLDASYLYYYLQSQIGRHELLRRLSGTAAEGIRQAELRKIQIHFPALEEQQKIALILSSFDDKIELNNKITKTLEEMASGIFKEWFVKSTNSEKLIVKNNVIKDIAYVKTGNRPGKLTQKIENENIIPVYGAKEITGYTKKSLYNQKIILTGRVGTIGEVFVVDGHSWPSDNTLILIPKDYDYFYFLYFLAKRINYLSLNRGSSQPLIAQSDIENYLINSLDKTFIIKFNLIVSKLFLLKENKENENQKLAALRDLLLPKLMKGEIRV